MNLNNNALVGVGTNGVEVEGSGIEVEGSGIKKVGWLSSLLLGCLLTVGSVTAAETVTVTGLWYVDGKQATVSFQPLADGRTAVSLAGEDGLFVGKGMVENGLLTVEMKRFIDNGVVTGFMEESTLEFIVDDCNNIIGQSLATEEVFELKVDQGGTGNKTEQGGTGNKQKNKNNGNGNNQSNNQEGNENGPLPPTEQGGTGNKTEQGGTGYRGDTGNKACLKTEQGGTGKKKT